MWLFIGGCVTALALVFLGEFFSHRSFADLCIRIFGGARAALYRMEKTAAKVDAKIKDLRARFHNGNGSK